jgi:hypothetical protein
MMTKAGMIHFRPAAHTKVHHVFDVASYLVLGFVICFRSGTGGGTRESCDLHIYSQSKGDRVLTMAFGNIYVQAKNVLLLIIQYCLSNGTVWGFYEKLAHGMSIHL